ncbi:Acyclic terpene utilization [Trinorchestia longiramus]|nr:Acyclic terpene utilization [Trinorchestia longiramus]
MNLISRLLVLKLNSCQSQHVYNRLKYDHNYVQRSSFSTSFVRSSETCRIGCASGFWGDTPTAVEQLVSGGKLDYLVLDYLSEITMSLLTAAKAKNPNLGYTPDFVLHAVGPQLKQIKEKGIRVISNAGGINPEACAAALQAQAAKAGVDIKVGIVTGDDLMSQVQRLADSKDLTSGEPLPAKPHSINAYTGAGAVIRALELGADVVITGRCADSALVLAPAAFHHDWELSSLEQSAGGSVAGHLLECGAQATGGNHTDWRLVSGWHNMGFPIASIAVDGSCVITKPPGTWGLLSRGTVCEQLLYEVGDPRSYVLPDLAVDITGVLVGEPQKMEDGEMGVMVWGAAGKPPTDTYKVGATYMSGFKATAVCIIGGRGAVEKGWITAHATLDRVNGVLKAAGISPITHYHSEVLGGTKDDLHARQSCVLWLSVQHHERKAVEVFSREVAAAGTGGVPGLMALVGGRPNVTPVLKLHSSLVRKCDVPLQVSVGGHTEEYCESGGGVDYSEYCHEDNSEAPHVPSVEGTCTHRLEDLALTRSGDKGDSCNIGVVARRPALLPLLQERLTAPAVARYMAHVFPSYVDPLICVRRYDVPGIGGLNFVLERSLGGGGVASLRPDAQGKAYGQLLLDFPLENMPPLQQLLD